MIEEMEVISVSSGRQIEEVQNLKPIRTNKTLLLFANPYFGNSRTVSSLPGTKKESENMDLQFSKYDYEVKKFVQREACEKNFKEAINNQKIFYFATHGFFIEEVEDYGDGKVFGVEVSQAKDNPMLRGGLMLADAELAISNSNQLDGNNNGILTAEEITNIPHMNGTEIVVLSACETGLGETKSGEGVYGLQRAFQVAGAKSIIMSLWKVSDEATEQLMVNFATNFLQSGDRISAFQKAQLTLKQKYPEPYFWGAFVLQN
ncbi:MAG: CHAT domain-containing protein [Flammeovirgaceae bacterium]